MKSKFKITILLLIGFLFPLICIGLYNLTPDFLQSVSNGNLARAVISFFILSLLILSFLLIVTEIKVVKVFDNEIHFKYVFPFLNKTYNWKDFDYFILTDEQSRYETVEVIYLIKNKKLKKVISSHYYKNFNEIRSEVRKSLDFKGKIYINYFSQLFLRLGLRQQKLP